MIFDPVGTVIEGKICQENQWYDNHSDIIKFIDVTIV